MRAAGEKATGAMTLSTVRSGPLLSILIFVLAAALAGTATWALTLRDDLAATRDDLDVLESEMASVRAGGTASAYTLAPTTDGPPIAHGVAYFPLSGSGTLSVSNLEPLAAGHSYQLWYISTDGPAAPIPGGTFGVDAGGQGFMLIPADVGSFNALAISVEPEPGSTTPTTPFILSGTTFDARG